MVSETPLPACWMALAYCALRGASLDVVSSVLNSASATNGSSAITTSSSGSVKPSCARRRPIPQQSAPQAPERNSSAAHRTTVQTRKRREAGPGARLAVRLECVLGYQVPEWGHPPLSIGAHVRV